MIETYVEKLLGKVRKYCLCVCRSSETMSVAKRSSVSCFWLVRTPVKMKDRVSVRVRTAPTQRETDLQERATPLGSLHHVAGSGHLVRLLGLRHGLER